MAQEGRGRKKRVTGKVRGSRQKGKEKTVEATICCFSRIECRGLR